jgi:hypothetical protein
MSERIHGTPESDASRRDFLRAGVLAGTALAVGACATSKTAARAPRRVAAGDKLRIAVIGCGGQGHHDLGQVAGEQIVALCDVDAARAAPAFAAHPQAKRYVDFRELLERERDLDAVVISTPDHIHAVAAAAAMRRGLHVYCQKPLTRTIAEARALTELAAASGVATSMGNQGTAMDGVRRGVEIVRAGLLGAVREAHVWTNRPVWKQGVARPEAIEPIPATLRWDLWLGPAPHRPYHSGYAPFAWRGWWDFGTGALGDMGCHTMNLPYLALELGAPTAVEAESSPVNDETGPLWSIVRYEFPARGARPPVRLVWYDGGKQPPKELLPGRAFASGGCLLIGERGTLYSPDDYGAKWELSPASLAQEAEAIPQSLPRSPGIHAEWLRACKGGQPALASFVYAGPFTEAVLLGNLAVRAGGRVEWDAAALRARNSVRADALVREEYAWGYSLEG